MANDSDNDDRDALDGAETSDEEFARRDDDAELTAEQEDAAPVTGLLGVERWVQFTFIAIAVTVFYVSDKLITLVWDRFAQPESTVVSGVAAALGIGTAFALYRNAKSFQFVHEVVSELARVTWPTKDETYYSTIVVIVTSVIAALYCGVFDAVWSAITGLVYNV